MIKLKSDDVDYLRKVQMELKQRFEIVLTLKSIKRILTLLERDYEIEKLVAGSGNGERDCGSPKSNRKRVTSPEDSLKPSKS